MVSVSHASRTMKIGRILALLLILGNISATWGGTLAVFHTPLGNIVAELYDADKPVTVQNFINLVNNGVYQDMFFHRCVPGFIIQGGGFFVTNRLTNPTVATVQNFGTITNEYSVGRHFSNSYGTIAMARVGGQTNSATSQWFFNLADNSANLDNVDGGFTVFGHVLSGTNLLNEFSAFGTSRTTNVIFNLGGVLSETPLLTTNATYNDLVYAAVSLPPPVTARLRLNADGSRQISWTSASNAVNTVEFATNLPPAWLTLTSTNGTGNLLQVIDASPRTARRFYRVRVNY